MNQPMKRKQFHMTKEDDKLLKDLARSKGISEAEVVREAVREYAKRNKQGNNPLLNMANKAKQHTTAGPEDLSINHDLYMLGLNKHDKQ